MPPVPIRTRPLDEVNATLNDLRAGKIVGRVVLTPAAKGETDVSSLVSIEAVGIHGQPGPEVSRPVRPQRAVSSEP
jgi:hypothetical protein